MPTIAEARAAFLLLKSAITLFREREDVPEHFGPVVCDCVRTLDQFLTGKNPVDTAYPRMWDELRNEFRYIIYLADGGYSRIRISIEEGLIVLDRRLSLPRVREHWDMLCNS